MSVVQSIFLPAHNVWPASNGGDPDIPLAVRVGGPDCLAVQGDGQYMVIPSVDSRGFFIGALESEFFPGTATSSGDALGFGLVDLPPGAVMTDGPRFVAMGFEVSGDFGPLEPGVIMPGDMQPVPEYYPVLQLKYNGDGYLFGYSLTAEQTLGNPIVHYIDGADYVLNGIGSPTTGTFGLCPEVRNMYLGPSFGDSQIILDYLAIQIDYSIPGQVTPPRRKYPRDDALGAGHGRIYPQPKSRQKSKRRGGGYV